MVTSLKEPITLYEVQEKKRLMESEIKEAVLKFEEETGLKISDISIKQEKIGSGSFVHQFLEVFAEVKLK